MGIIIMAIGVVGGAIISVLTTGVIISIISYCQFKKRGKKKNKRY